MQRALNALARPVDRQIGFLAVAILLLNIVDAYASLYFVVVLKERELNSMYVWLLSRDPYHFVVFKIMAASALVLGFISVGNAGVNGKPYWRWTAWGIFVFYFGNALYLVGSLTAIWYIVNTKW